MINRTKIILKANSKRVIPLFLTLGRKERIEKIVSMVSSLDKKIVEKTLKNVLNEFENRHSYFKEILLKHYKIIEKFIPKEESFSKSRKLLLGSFLTKEYSVQSAALFNPSIVAHPNQNELKEGELRFVMSLRATGEGHISSIAFSTGTISKKGEIFVDNDSSTLVCPEQVENKKFQKSFIKERAKFFKEFDNSIVELLPEEFTSEEAFDKLQNLKKTNETKFQIAKFILTEIFDNNYEIVFRSDLAINSQLIFPLTKSESMGMEDVRFVKFTDETGNRYIGTYTAYNGSNIKIKLIETSDFKSFSIHSLYGKAATDKGMALFPEKINGKYAMIGRQGGRSISIMYSDNLYFWDKYEILQEPERVWEVTQIGNSGSPIKTPSGWLLLTHAVGPLRKYVISASLLDIDNPSKLLASLDKPLISPNSIEREGYVPNVAYSCGIIQHYDKVIIPYAISDSASSFATININILLNELLPKK